MEENADAIKQAVVTHKRVVTRVFWASSCAAVLSVAWAFWYRWSVCHCHAASDCKKALAEDPYSRLVVLLWICVPPLWFLYEWVSLSKGLPAEMRADIAHSHDLARNIWLALVVLLTAVLGLQLFKLE
jgi:hypothetical protein